MDGDFTEVLARYRASLNHYKDFTSRLENLLSDLCKSSRAKVHFVESRTKTPESFLDKIQRPEKSYSDPLTEVTDLVGERIVLYYQDDLKVVHELLKREFTIVEEVHTHQAEKYDPDRFGYLSMHYVLRLGSSRSMLPEWRAFEGLVAEVQVRTVLQHAWAAVSHAMQYKREGDVPSELKRRLSRLAGLFELADEEFISIRDTRQNLNELAVEAIESRPRETPIDIPSVSALVEKSTELAELIGRIAQWGYLLRPRPAQDDFAAQVVDVCRKLGIQDLEELNSVLKGEHDKYLEAMTQSLGPWHVTHAFVLLLLIIHSYIDRFTVDELTSRGWSKGIAEQVISAAQVGRG